MKNKKFIIIAIIVILVIVGYFLIFKKKSDQVSTTTNVGAVVGDQVITNDGQEFKYEDGTKLDIDINASKISASPSGERFLAYIDPSSDYPVGKQKVFSASGESVILSNNAEEAHWLKDSTFIYTKKDGENVKILVNSPTAENEIFGGKCQHISLIIANSSNIIANCSTSDDLYITYLINVDDQKSSKLNLLDNNVIISASADLNFFLTVDPNKTESEYSLVNKTTGKIQELTSDFYPDSVKWINSRSFVAISDNTDNAGYDDTNLILSNILMKFTINDARLLEESTMQTFASSIIDYNVVNNQIVALLADKSKIKVDL